MSESEEAFYVAGDSAVCAGCYYGDGDDPRIWLSIDKSDRLTSLALGHPRVWLAIDKSNRVTCAYCSRVFVRQRESVVQIQVNTDGNVEGGEALSA